VVGARILLFVLILDTASMVGVIRGSLTRRYLIDLTTDVVFTVCTYNKLQHI